MKKYSHIIEDPAYKKLIVDLCKLQDKKAKIRRFRNPRFRAAKSYWQGFAQGVACARFMVETLKHVDAETRE